jgi:hypothetical protein
MSALRSLSLRCLDDEDTESMTHNSSDHNNEEQEEVLQLALLEIEQQCNREGLLGELQVVIAGNDDDDDDDDDDADEEDNDNEALQTRTRARNSPGFSCPSPPRPPARRLSRTIAILDDCFSVMDDDDSDADEDAAII